MHGTLLLHNSNNALIAVHIYRNCLIQIISMWAIWIWKASVFLLTLYTGFIKKEPLVNRSYCYNARYSGSAWNADRVHTRSVRKNRPLAPQDWFTVLRFCDTSAHVAVLKNLQFLQIFPNLEFTQLLSKKLWQGKNGKTWFLLIVRIGNFLLLAYVNEYWTN